MTTIDAIILSFVVGFVLLGFVRGMGNQLMSVVGLIAAYFLSARVSQYMQPKFAQALGSSEEYAKLFGVIWAAVLIYIACVLLGYVIRQIFFGRSESLGLFNRIGGGILGALKACFILMLAFYILQLVPKNVLEARTPKLAQSKTYSFFSTHTFMDPKYIESVSSSISSAAAEAEHLKETISDRTQKMVEKTESDMNNKEMNDVLAKHAAPANPAAKPKKPVKK